MATPETKTAFQEWLAGADGGAFQFRENTLIRVQKNTDFDYLYHQRHYNGTGIERGDKFEYAGIYCKRDGLVYDGQYAIQELAAEPGEFGKRDDEALRECLKADVRNAVEAAIGNDRNNLRITELTTARDIENLSYFQKHSAADMAREAYLNGDDEDDEFFTFTFHCQYDPERWTEDSLLAYILDPAGYVAAEAAAYIENEQEDMLAAFLRADMIAAEYKALMENPLHPVHRVKRIMAAVGASSAKTVTVTVCINDEEFTFKTDAGEFRRDCTFHYSEWHIVAADRREFERRFGRSAHYGPEDILRIEYARKVIYEAQEVTV